MKHIFLYDPKAFFDQQWKMDTILDHIGQFFRTQENPDWSIHMSRYRRDAIVIIQEELGKGAISQGARVYAIGGEEILFDCINGAAHFPNVQVSVIPHGEFSNYTSIFGDKAIESFRDIPSVIQGEAHPTDLIRWGVNYALTSCYIGLNSVMAANVKNLKASLGKGIFMIFSKFTGIITSLLTIFDKSIIDQEYKITIDDADYSGHYCLVHVANGPYHLGKKTGLKDAVPNDGVLDIALIRSSGPLRTLMAVRRYSRGGRSRHGVYLQAKKISIRSEKQMWIHLDNEYFQDTHVEISVASQIIQMAAPAGLKYPPAALS